MSFIRTNKKDEQSAFVTVFLGFFCSVAIISSQFEFQQQLFFSKI